MSWSLSHLRLESPVWTGLLPKGDQVLGDVHLEDVLPGPPQDGLQQTEGFGKCSHVVPSQVRQQGLILPFLHLVGT